MLGPLRYSFQVACDVLPHAFKKFEKIGNAVRNYIISVHTSLYSK